MPDLATALQQVLRQVVEGTMHSEACSADWACTPRGCSCDWQDRVEAEQARRWAASLQECEHNASAWASDQTAVEDFPAVRPLEAALVAAQQERGSA